MFVINTAMVLVTASGIGKRHVRVRNIWDAVEGLSRTDLLSERYVDGSYVVTQAELTIHRIPVGRSNGGEAACNDTWSDARKAEELIGQASRVYLVDIGAKLWCFNPLICKRRIRTPQTFVRKEEENFVLENWASQATAE